MGLADDIAACAIRVSLGAGNDESDIDAFVAVYGEFASRAGTSAA
jgi:cysteine sulfinate desulfinase/cysteine desulfurase-like protein